MFEHSIQPNTEHHGTIIYKDVTHDRANHGANDLLRTTTSLCSPIDIKGYDHELHILDDADGCTFLHELLRRR